MSQKIVPSGLASRSFHLSDWLVEPRLNRLSRDEESIQIELKMMDVLVCLAEHAGELVERQQLVDTVWSTEFISENILTRAIAELRNVLGDDAKNPSFIETIHRRGYRLIAPMEPTAATVHPFPARAGRPGDERSPYPGLSAFTEDDAEFFFGREGEVAQLWRKITSRRLLAVIGPSGVGKSSLLRAGLIPSAPDGWGVIVCQPGDSPYSALARALAPEFRDDPGAIAKLVDIRDDDTAVAVFSRWRGLHDNVLLIIDQFEELFTQSPLEIQESFTAVLRRFADQSDVNVLLAMRDDFLIACNDHEALSPIFSDLTPIKTPSRTALRRALINPAAGSGYTFEDEKLVDELLEAVEGEQGALPLLAFTLARLWEERDRERRMLTSEAYRTIGGVHGSLALHAETTLAAIDGERHAIVRELFRNLITAQGTRAAREVDDLLSVFDDPESAREPLAALIDARLLTSYEATTEDGETRRTVEIVHESLLAAWPRLVRWHTQDADAAQLRDELRQAARTWDEHGRPPDRLWTGSAFREFSLWRERYPGGLSETEEDFASAITSHAGRRRRRRRLAVATVMVAGAVITSVITVLWRQSVHQERRAEAQKLIAMGKVQMDDYPTSALAHATRSLQLADSAEARFLALEALWKGPTAFIVNETPSIYASFSPDMGWLVQSHDFSSSLAIISRDGVQKTLDHPSGSGTTRLRAAFGRAEDIFWSKGQITDEGRIALWSASEGRLLASAVQMDKPDLLGRSSVISGDSRRPRAVSAMGKDDLVTIDALDVDGGHERLGEVLMTAPPGQRKRFCLDNMSGEWLALVEGNEISTVWIGDGGLSDRRHLGRHEGSEIGCWEDPQGRYFITFDRAGGIKRWDPSNQSPPSNLSHTAGIRPYRLSKDGSYMMATSTPDSGDPELSIWSIDETGIELVRWFDGVKPDFRDFDPVGLRLVIRGPLPAHRLWSLEAPAGAKPLVLHRGSSAYSHIPEFSPDGNWLATNDRSGLAMWPLVRSYPAVIDIPFKAFTYGVAFGPEGRFLATSTGSEVRVWPLEGPVPPAGHIVFEAGRALADVAVSPEGDLFAAATGAGGSQVWIGRDGEEPRALAGSEDLSLGTFLVGFSPDGRFIAALDGGYDPASKALHVWEVAADKKIATLRLDGERFTKPWAFSSDGRLITGSTKGVVAWDVETGEHELLVEIRVRRGFASGDGRRLLVTERKGDGEARHPVVSPTFFDLDTGEVTVLSTHGLHVQAMSMDEEGKIAVTGDSSGIIRVGPVSGEEPHLLLGHDTSILCLAIDPLGRWIASGGQDGTLRLWPMPDLSKPPLHTLPREELIEKLKTLTNLRVIHDEGSPTGWTLTHDPFPGWAEVPTW